MSHEGNDKIIDKAIDDTVRGIECPTCSLTDTYTVSDDYREYRLVLMCNDCEAKYAISFEEVKDGERNAH